MKLLLIEILLVIIGVVNCSSYNVIGDDKCKKINEKEVVNYQKVAGTWYQMASSKYVPTPASKCNTIYQTYNSNNNTLSIRSEIFNYLGGPESVDWYGICEEGVNKMEYINYKPPAVQIYYFRKFSDYNLYDLVYGCVSVNNVYQGTMILMLGRTCPYTQEAFSAAKDRLAMHGIQEDWVTYDGATCCGK